MGRLRQACQPQKVCLDFAVAALRDRAWGDVVFPPVWYCAIFRSSSSPDCPLSVSLGFYFITCPLLNLSA